MSRIRKLAKAGTLAAPMLVLGCNAGKSAIVAPKVPSPGVVELRVREASHHESTMQASSARSAQEETSRYAIGMRATIDSMMTCCRGMGSGCSNIFGGLSAEEMRPMLDRMRQAVAAHESQVSALEDVVSIRAECAMHHEQIVALLAEIDARMNASSAVRRRTN